MTNQITPADLEALPEGAEIRDAFHFFDPTAGEDDYSDYRKNANGEWEVYDVSENLQAVLKVHQMLHDIIPSPNHVFQDAVEYDRQYGEHTFTLLSSPAQADSTEAAA